LTLQNLRDLIPAAQFFKYYKKMSIPWNIKWSLPEQAHHNKTVHAWNNKKTMPFALPCLAFPTSGNTLFALSSKLFSADLKMLLYKRRLSLPSASRG
jgi:hypothetical protein